MDIKKDSLTYSIISPRVYKVMVNPRVNTFSYTAFTYIPFRITIFILGLVQCLGQIMKDPSMDFLTCFCHSLSFTPYILKSAFFSMKCLDCKCQALQHAEFTSAHRSGISNSPDVLLGTKSVFQH